MEAVSSFAHPETASLPESNYQIGAFENFHQLVEDALIVLGPRPQYELRFANRMKSQLLISHRFLLIKHKLPRRLEEGKIKPPSENIPVFLGISHQFLFQYGRARKARKKGGVH